MSDQKKIGGAFPQSGGAFRDAIPTADEGDALLDMLFDDAPRGSNEPPASEILDPDRPTAHGEVDATPIPGALSRPDIEDAETSVVLPDTKPPPAPTGGAPVSIPRPPPAPPSKRAGLRGEIVSPPGWATGAPSPRPGAARTSEPRATVPTMPEPDMNDVATRAFTSPLPDFDDDPPPAPEEQTVAIDGMDDEDRMDATVVAPNAMLVAESYVFDAEARAQAAHEPTGAAFDSIGFTEPSFDGEGEEPAEAEAAAEPAAEEMISLAPEEESPSDDDANAAAIFAAAEAEDEASIEAYAEEPPAEAEAEAEPAAVGAAAPQFEARPLDDRAAHHLLAQTPGLRESFVERAAWLRAEAALTPDKQKRARLLLVVAEIDALAGEDASAAQAAQEAYQLGPNLPLVSRAHRSMVLRSGDPDAFVEVLEGEIRHSPTPEGRAHAAWLGAEMARIAQRDEAQAKKRAEQAMRAAPSDPRPSVQRFVEAALTIPDPASLAKLRPADPEALAPLGQAFATVAHLRGAPLAKGAAPKHVVEMALAARAALGSPAPTPKEAASQVQTLGALRGTSMRGAASWLTAMIAASRDETRPNAVAALRDVAGSSIPARRALAAFSVETQESVDPRDEQAFSAVDRIALAALDAARPHPAGRAAREMLASILDEAAATSASSEIGVDVAHVTGPVVAALLPMGDQRLSRLRFVQAGGAGTRAAALLGRILASVRSVSDQTHEVLDQALTDLVQNAEPMRPEWAAYVRSLGLELDIDASAAERVAQAIATWGSDGDRAADPGAILASALLAELSHDSERASAAYADLHREDPSCEAIVRAAAAQGGSPIDPAVARMLREHAEQLPAGPRRAVLLTECAIRFSSIAHTLSQEAPDSADATALLEEADLAAKAAAELAPNLPIAVHLGEIGARARGDQDSLVEWLRFRRESSDDPIERAHDLTREALLVSDGESTGASTLLETALQSRTNDFGLRDLYERLSPEPTSDRAAWREARIPEVPPVEGGRLAIEAALEYERNGDLEAAARCARLAETLGERELSPIAAYRFALHGAGTAELVDALLPQARSTEDAAVRLELYERLAELDERGREDTGSGLLFRRTILEENPSHIRTLRRVASALMAGGRTEELEPIAMELARNLEGGEAVAWAALAVRLRMRWEETAEPVAIAYAQTPRPLWAIRQMGAHARARSDFAVAAQCDRELMAITDRPNERATLALRAAQALRATGDLETSLEMLSEAVQQVPEHVVARLELASVLEDTSDFANAAVQLESAAESLKQPDWRLELDMRAAELWQDRVGDVDKARAALERVAAIDPNDVRAFERLRQIYVAANARAELAELLGRRIDAIEDPAERVEMEVMRGRALAEVGDAEAAKRALAAALDANPDHVEALSSFANLCFEDGDYDGAEQALIRLARLTSDPDKQAEIYMQLGHLYDELLPNDERAELAYQEVIKRRPSDESAREKLIALYRRVGQTTRAVEEQNLLVAAAEAPDDKCKRTIELAEILEELGELKKAESTLVVARKSFPKSDLALRALVRFYQRTGQAPAAAILLDRAVADARRALGTGRFETFLFETLATAAELRNRADAASVARAAVHAIEGQQVDLSGAGLRAGDAALDELLAPEVMTPAFRDLLQRTGGMLDTAFPYDLEVVRAGPAPASAPVAEEVRAVAGAYGLPQIQLLVSAVLGPICVPARSHPPTIVMGQSLAAQEPSPERTFLIHRAMKVLQANAAVFARTAPIDLWPLLAAYLRVFSPQFTPQGVDAARFQEAFGRLSRALPPGLGHDVGLLSADVIGSIGNRASTLNAAINGWGSRAGLLAVGDSNVALTAIAWAGGNANGPPAVAKDRLTWIGRNAEARDLVIFSVSDAYVDARTRLGAG